MKFPIAKTIMAVALSIASFASVYAEDVKNSAGEILGTCEITSSEIKYDRTGNEVVWVKVKVKNNTGNRIRGTVYGNNGGSSDFSVKPYDYEEYYLSDCKEIPSYLICDNAK